MFLELGDSLGDSWVFQASANPTEFCRSQLPSASACYTFLEPSRPEISEKTATMKMINHVIAVLDKKKF